MKKHLLRLFCATAFFIIYNVANAQQLELYSGSGSGSGPSVAPQTATFYENIARSTTFTAHAPTLTVTASLSNQRYAPVSGISASPGVNFAGYNGFGWSVFAPMNYNSGATNSQYTSAGNAAAGTNFDIANNYGFTLDINSAFWKPSPGANRATNFRESFADLTLTFNQRVVNPVIHLTDMGAASSGSSTVNGVTTSYGLGAYGELEMLTSGLTLTKLSGSSHLVLDATNTKILNNNAAQSQTDMNVYISQAQGGGGGSIKINTPAAGITSVTFRLYLKGTGGVGTPGPPTSAQWGLVEEFYLSVSVEPVNVLPIDLLSFSGNSYNDINKLAWKTANAVGFSRFELQRSDDGNVFENIAVIPQNPLSDSYAYDDKDPLQGINYYRLRMIDIDGRYKFSNVITIVNRTGGTKYFNIINPSPPGEILVTTNHTNPAFVLYTSAGARMQATVSKTGINSYRLITANAKAGVYFISMQDQNGEKLAKKIVLY
jgi:hypothetical protein